MAALEKEKKTEVATQPQPSNGTLARKEMTNSERFTAMVVREFAGTGTEIALTAFQKRLVSNYFIHLDQVLKTAEVNRMKKSENYRDKVALAWPNVNMEELALRVVACARIGFDPAQPNHIAMIPYKNNSTGKYDIGFVEEYRGKELKARKYGYDVPDVVVVELVFANDTFKQFKKDKDNSVETYEFKVTDSFNRGELVGGFYYHAFTDHPEKNKIMVYNKHDIEKRKPEYASPEFWGGEKDEWKDGKKTGKKIKVEGWYEEMMYKTMYRLAYGSITIDSHKIDDDYIKLSLQEHEANETVELRASHAIESGANMETIDLGNANVVEPVKPVDAGTKETKENPKKDPPAEQPKEEIKYDTDNNPIVPF